MKSSLGLLLCGVFLLSFATFNFAQSEKKFGSHVQELQRWLHPSLKFQTEYDNNVFLEPSNEDEDFIFILTPGLFVNVPFSGNQHLLTLDYNVDLAAFAEFDDQNYANHDLLGNLDLNFPDFYVTTYDNFQSTSVRGATEFTDRVARIENLYSVDVGSGTWNKLSATVGYDFYLVGYSDDDFTIFDRKDHTLTGSGFYQLFPKSKALLEYNHAFLRYDDNGSRDGDFDQIRVGLTGEILPKLVGTVKVGYQDRRYDDSDQDWSNGVVNMSLVENFSEHTTLTLAFDRSASESVYSTNNFYSVNVFSASLNQRLFFDRLDGRLGLSFQNNDYPQETTEGSVTQERDDDIYDIEIGLDYAIRDWLLTGAEYHYTERDSNFGIFDYSDNRVLWKIEALF